MKPEGLFISIIWISGIRKSETCLVCRIEAKPLANEQFWEQGVYLLTAHSIIA